MNSLLSVKKGKTSLPIAANDLYCSHNQKDMTESGPIPKIIPLYDGQELNINQQLIMKGLSTISIRNMHKYSNENTIKKRNSFFNLHRPELKGLNIIAHTAENKTKNTLQKCILKEIKTINKINSMRSVCKLDTPQCSSSATRKSHAAQLMERYFPKRPKSTIAPTKFERQDLLFDNNSADTELKVSSTPVEEDKSCDVEIKSTLIY